MMHLHSLLAPPISQFSPFQGSTDKQIGDHAIDERRSVRHDGTSGKATYASRFIFRRRATDEFRDRVPRIVYSRRSWIAADAADARNEGKSHRSHRYISADPRTIHTCWRRPALLCVPLANACGAARAFFRRSPNTESPERVRARAPRESTTVPPRKNETDTTLDENGQQVRRRAPEERDAGKGRVRRGGEARPGEPGKPPLLLAQHPT